MRLRGIALLVLLLAAPLAAAGSGESPHVESPRDRRDPSGDLLAAWLASDPAGLRISFRVADLDARETLRVYAFVIRVDGVSYAPAIGFDPMGRLRTDSGSNPNGWGSPRAPARVDDALVAATLARSGDGDVLSAVVPWGLYGLRDGADVVPLSASSSLYDARMQRWIVPYDNARASAEEPVRIQATQATTRAGPFPILVPAWVIPTLVVGLAVGGLATGGALAWATRTPPAPPAPSARPTPPPPAPPGKRFRKQP